MAQHAARRGRLADRRWRALALTGVVVVAGGIAIANVADRSIFGAAPRSSVDASAPVRQEAMSPAQREIHQRFQQGVVMLHAKQHQHALTAFHRVLELDPALPEAHVNMGFALIGLQRYQTARDFFESAIALRKQQLNAYYGLAVALEGAGDRIGAIAAMRTYAHLARRDDPYLRKANAALWEWESERGQSAQPLAGGAAAEPTRRK